MKKLIYSCLAVMLSLFITTKTYSQTNTLSVTISPTYPCVGASNGTAKANVHAGTPPYTYLWKPSNATTEIILGLSIGDSISVVVTDSKGNSGLAFIEIDRTSSPSIQLTSVGYCAGTLGSATVHQGGYQYLWSNGQTLQTATGLAEGLYFVTVTDSQSCSATDSIYVTSFENSKLLIHSPPICKGKQATILATGGDEYLWNTGDISESIVVSPNTTTTYSVKITKATCSNTFTTTVGVDNIVTALQYTSGCAQTCFTNSSTSTYGIATFHWDFGGTSSTLKNPCHVFSSAGVHTVTLVVTSHVGCVEILKQQIQVSSSELVANFSSNDGCAKDPIQFTDLSTIPSGQTGQITSWAWSFGDPNSGAANTSTAQNPAHKFSKSGSFITMLVVTSSGGCSDTISKMVTVHGPMLNLSMKKDNVNPQLWYLQPTLFDGANVTYLWNFGDGTTSTDKTPTHTYANPGHYSICLTIDSSGCTTSTCDSTYRTVSPGIIGTLKVLPAVQVSVQEQTISDYAIYPNPASNLMTISFRQVTDGELRISDMTGRVIHSEKIKTDRASIDVSNLPAGFYNLSVISGGGVSHNKIMIVR